METPNKNPFPEIRTIEVPKWLRSIGRFFVHLHDPGLSEHFVNPLDDTFDAPAYQQETFGFTDMGEYLERE